MGIKVVPHSAKNISKGMRGSEKESVVNWLNTLKTEDGKLVYGKGGRSITPQDIKRAFKLQENKAKQGKAIGGPIESPMEKKQKPLYEEELGMYGGGSVRKKVYARGGSTRPTRG